MKRMVQSLAGGALVVLVLFITLALSGESLFALLLFWPIFIFRPLFPPAGSDPLFPFIPRGTGLLVSLIFATLVYSFLVYVVLYWSGRGKRLS